MRFFRRSLIALGVAASLPTVVLLAAGTYVFLREESRQLERETLGRAQMLAELVDTRLQGDVATLTVIAGSSFVETHKWAELYARLQRVRATSPHWATLVLYDAATGAAIFDLQQPFGTRDLPPLDADVRTALRKQQRPVIGSMRTDSEPLAYVYVPVAHDSELDLVIAAGLRPSLFQELIASHAAAVAVAALLDQEGHVVARSIDPEQWLGKPAPDLAKGAITTERQGYYRARTHEGLDSFTAFYASPWSGWSTHVAIASARIDAPLSWSLVVAGGAALGGLLLGGILMLLVLRDMAERRRTEEALRQSQKMEAIGQLTGGIAHDFNNLLTAILGNVDLIRTRSIGNDRIQRLASNALEAARRGTKLAAQLLAFSRNQRMQVESVSLTQLLGGMGDLLVQSVGPAITITTHVHPDADSVLSDVNQLELALLNLAVNARDAMPHGGKLEIDVRPASYRDVRGLPKRPYVAISVKDSGTGMPEHVRTRAMEPFFTTKSVGQGTGLGLSQVYGIVRESGGAVHIDSAPNQGTTVRLILPAAPPVAVSTNSREETAPTIPSPSANVATRILVVDDDHQVRRFIAESLRTLGFSVTDVATGEAGLTALRAAAFDLLVADFAMPGMNGAELVREACRIRPELRALIVSGYANSAELDSVLGEARMLRKPFAVAELSAAVAQALNRKPT
jgi:signal transduction histidine kinase